MLAQRPQRISGLPFDKMADEDDYDTDVAANLPDTAFVDDAEKFARALDNLTVPAKSAADQRADLFELVDRHYHHAAKKVRELRQLRGSAADRDSSSQDSMDLDEADEAPSAASQAEDVRNWEQEAQMWDLLRRVLPLRYSKRNTLRPIRRGISKFQSSSDLWDDFLQSDLIAQERKAILECLQTSANESRAKVNEIVKDYEKQANRGSMTAHGWLHTRLVLKKQKSTGGWVGPLDPKSSDAGRMVTEDKKTPLVTQLDPDAVTRQGRKLESGDEYFERAIWLGCYELLRRGRSLSEIRAFCVERQQVWRAVSMSAMPLSKVVDLESVSTDPMAILLWRRTCFALARQGGINDYERAVYGILSGDVSSVEKICTNWDDFVFAHYNSLLRAQFDEFIMKRSPSDATAAIRQNFSSFNALQFHGDSSSASERLVSSLESNKATRGEAKTPMKALQAAIISDNLTQYMHDLGAVLGKRANLNGASFLIPEIDSDSVDADDPRFCQLHDHQGLRAATHVYLVITSLDRLQGGEAAELAARTKAQDNIIATYVSTLRLSGLTDLMPLYCSKLDEDRGFYTLSRNISRIVDPRDRDRILRLMEKMGMDIGRFVFYQPYSLLDSFPITDPPPPAFGAFSIFLEDTPSVKYGRPMKPDFFGDESETLDLVDEPLISSLEWFLQVEGLWDEFFQAGTLVYKRFLKSFNLQSARSLCERIKCADIFRKKAGFPIPNDNDVSWFADAYSSAREGIFEEDGLSAEDFVKAKPFFELECLVRVLDAIETVASTVRLEQNPREIAGKEMWTYAGDELKKIKSCMVPLMDGWLLESAEEDEDFAYIRDAYLAETVLGYVSVLHVAGTHLSRDSLLECMDLASVIAKKDNDVAGAMMKAGRMKELVEGFAGVSKALALSAGEKRSLGSSSKKARERGWSRELWQVKK
ncbi:nuclear pore protein 84/107 [Xylariaceae sp. FL1272]|nr:nuclear pore protein 84/107 [Xylariaceae sp. FL1272]